MPGAEFGEGLFKPAPILTTTTKNEDARNPTPNKQVLRGLAVALVVTLKANYFGGGDEGLGIKSESNLRGILTRLQ